MSEFHSGFEQAPPAFVGASRNKQEVATRALTKQSSQWSRVFGGMLQDFISHAPIDSELALEKLDRYTSPALRQYTHLTGSTLQQIALEQPKLSYYLNDHTFHTINQELVQHWQHLVAPEQVAAPDYFDLTLAQIRLSVRALQLVKARSMYRELIIDQNPLTAPEDHGLDSSFVGSITQVEAMMATLEVIKEQRASDEDPLVVVPAPLQFGRLAPQGATSHQLLISPTNDRIASIRVATRHASATNTGSIPSSFIRGFDDLGNQRTKLIGTKELPISAPGLLSADFILHHEALQHEGRYSRITGIKDLFGPILDAKATARELEPHLTYGARLERAAANIGPRILYALDN